MPQEEIKPWDTITPANMRRFAERMMESPSFSNKDLKVPLEHRMLVLVLLSSKWKYKDWKYKDLDYYTTSYPIWRTLSDVNNGWYRFGDYLKGKSFADCLSMALELCDGSSQSYVPSWREINMDKDDPEYVVAKTCTAAMESEAELSDETKVVLSLPPVIIVAMHFWAKERMMDAVSSEHSAVYEGDLQSTAKSIRREFPLLLEAFVNGAPEILKQTVNEPIQVG